MFTMTRSVCCVSLFLKYIFSLIMTVDGSEILSQQKDMARPEFELTSPLKKYTEVRVVDRLASN